MTDQDGTQDPASSDGTDVSGAIRGLQAVVSRKENERRAALERAEAAEDLARELQARLDSIPEPAPRIDRNNPMRQPAQSPDVQELLARTTWADLGVTDDRL